MAPPKRPWFRFYVEAVHDRKLRRLKPETRWLFVACLAAARQSPTPGFLLVADTDPMTWEDLMDFAGMTRRQVEDGMDALQEAGIIDLRDQTWFVPNWNARQYESDDVTSRTRLHRSKEVDGTTMERSKNADGTPDGTPPENREQRTELVTSSSSNPVTRPAGSEEKDSISVQVWALLAQHDAETFSAKGGTIKSRAWFVTAADTRRMAHERQLAELTEAHADWTAGQLAQAIIDTGSGLVSQDDKAVAAMRARIGTNERRRRGEVCPECDDRGVVELEDGTVVDCRCKSLRSA